MATAHFTPSQQKAIAIAPKFTAFLSLVGSGYISCSVLSDSKKRRQSYHRLLMAMSLYDVCQSVSFFLTTWPTPAGTPGVFGAVGTTETCSAQGLFLFLGFAVPTYNASLSLYYLLLIRYNFSDARLKKLELAAHLLPLLYYVPAAIAFAVMGYYNSFGNLCTLSSLPYKCNEDDACLRGDMAAMFRKVFGLIPHCICLVIGTVAMAMLYWSVRVQENRNSRFAGTRLARGDDSSSKHRKSRMVARQALLYLAAFYFCFTWAMISRISVAGTGELQFSTYFMGTLFIPLQGFFNMIVYRRPKWLKVREPTSFLTRSASGLVSQSRSILGRLSARRSKEDASNALSVIRANEIEAIRAQNETGSSTTSSKTRPPHRVTFPENDRGDPEDPRSAEENNDISSSGP